VDIEKTQIVVNLGKTKKQKKQADKLTQCVISGLRHETDENCAMLGYYATNGGGNFLPTFRDR